MKKRWLWLAMVTALAVLTAGPLFAATLYDDFGEDYINKALWRDYDPEGTDINEQVREIKDGALVLKLGSNEANNPVRNNMEFQNPNTITRIDADVRIVAINNDPTDSGPAFARIGGWYYNRIAAAPTDSVGNIWAQISLGDRGDGLEAWYDIVAQTGSGFDDIVMLESNEIATGLALNTTYTLSISYDGDDGFTFQISGGGGSGSTVDASGPARVGPSFDPNRNIAAAVGGLNDRADAYVHAIVDNVYVNGASNPYDSFDTAPIDMSKWRSAEIVREAVDGRVRLHQRAADNTFRNRLDPRDRYTDHLEATLRIESGSQVSSGARGRVRLRGYFYAEDDTYGDYDGEVRVTLWLNLNDAGALSARTAVSVSDANEVNYTERYSATFPTAIAFDTDYLLSIDLDRTAGTLVFKCNNDTLTYTIQTPIFPPYDSFRGIEARLDLDGGESGYLKAQVDDVYVADPVYTNLTGYWYAEIANVWSTPVGCASDAGDDDYIRLLQNGVEVELIDPTGHPVYGLISDATLLFETFEEGGEYSGIELTMTDANTGSGSVNMWESDGCNHGFHVDLSRATPGTIQFSAADFTVSEDGTSATVTVRRTGGDDGAVSVDYACSDGTAIGGSDYTAASGTLTWADGEDGDKSFTIAIADDADDEGDETVNLSLSNLTGMAVMGQPSTATLTISDNDTSPAGSFQFTTPAFTVAEDGGSATITVSRTGGSDGAVSVDYASSDGTATDGSDYTATSGTLSWADGDSADKSFTLTIADDADDEADETVNLTLSNPTGSASLGTTATTVLTISDNDDADSGGNGGGGGGCFIGNLTP